MYTVNINKNIEPLAIIPHIQSYVWLVVIDTKIKGAVAGNWEDSRKMKVITRGGAMASFVMLRNQQY
jgi:hypothetical protein